jgi:hypothetical protein
MAFYKYRIHDANATTSARYTWPSWSTSEEVFMGPGRRLRVLDLVAGEIQLRGLRANLRPAFVRSSRWREHPPRG